MLYFRIYLDNLWAFVADGYGLGLKNKAGTNVAPGLAILKYFKSESIQSVGFSDFEPVTIFDLRLWLYSILHLQWVHLQGVSELFFIPKIERLSSGYLFKKMPQPVSRSVGVHVCVSTYNIYYIIIYNICMSLYLGKLKYFTNLN